MISAEQSVEPVEPHRLTRVVKRVTSREEQDEEALTYWMSQSPEERVRAALEITEMALSTKGADALRLGRSERTLTHIQRSRR